MSVLTLATVALTFAVGASDLVQNCIPFTDTAGMKERLYNRQGASENSTVHLRVGASFRINFTLPREEEVCIVNVTYCNFGNSDIVAIYVDEEDIGQFITDPFGWSWTPTACFGKSGMVGGKVKLDPGEHSLSVRLVTSDAFGVEIDSVEMKMHGKPVSKDELQVIKFYCENAA